MQQSRKLYHLSMHFIEQSKREVAKKMLLQSFEIATEYGFTLLAYNCATELMIDASMNRKASKFEFYKKKKDELFADLKAEDFIQECYFRIALHVNKNRGVKEDLFSEMLNKLDEYYCTSTKFVQYYYMICTFKNLNSTDYPRIKKEAGYALEILRERKGVYKSILQFFSKNKAFAHIALKENEEARQLLLEAEKYSQAYSYNLGILKYYQAINELHIGNYETVYELYRSNKKNKYETLSEQWTILGAYLYYLKRVGKLETGIDRFSIGKYLNETVGNVHDKTGNKVNILIGELLVYLVKNRGKFIDRVESINKYSYKNLKSKDTQRAKWFIRILCMLPRANFNSVKLKRIARRQIENLREHPVYLGDNLSIEIIPFEYLLETVIEQLDRKVA